MTGSIEIRDEPPQRILAKRATCAHSDIGPTFTKSIHSVGECLRSSGGRMASMPMCVYLAWRTSDCDIAVGCVVEGEVALTNGCEWLDVPSGPHAVADHFGPYDTLRETHETIRRWCGENGRQLTGSCWETYPTDPGMEPDVGKWQTVVHYPVSA